MTFILSVDEHTDKEKVLFEFNGDPDQGVTLGGVEHLLAIEQDIKTAWAKLEDGEIGSDEALEEIFSSLEVHSNAPSGCPLCGRYTDHSHNMD